MSSVTQKIWKRKCYPVTVNEESFHLRALSIADRRRMDGIEDVLAKNFYGLGRGLVDATGNELYPQQAGETPTDYAARLEEILGEIPTDTFNQLCAVVNKLGIVPPAEVLAKN